MKLGAYIGVASIALVSAQAAAAQEVEKQQGEKQFEEGVILVTAAKRSESLQDVPVSVAAITGDALAKSKITNLDALTTKVSNLQLNGIQGDNTPIFSLRGVSMADYSLNQSSPVATYFDEVYKGNTALFGVAMYDLERVEVLKGPQGTLYGKNTTGGAINLITRNAELGDTNGYLNAGYGNYDRFDASGAINLPLGDAAALRVAGTFARADGWFENQVPGMPDLAEVREWGLRASLYVEPSDAVRFTLRGATSLQNPHNYGIYATPEAINRPGLTGREIESNVPKRRRIRTHSVSLSAEFDVSDSLTVTSITSYDKGSLSMIEDTDGVAIQLLEIPYDDEAKQFTQDLRLTSDTGGPFDFILGAYYSRERIYNSSNLKIGLDFDLDGSGAVDVNDCLFGFEADPALGLAGIACQFKNEFNQNKSSYAIYTDLKYELSDNLTLRGGLRYTHDKGRQFDFVSNVLDSSDSFIFTLIPSSELSFSTDNLSGKIGLDYKFDSGNMVYVSVSRGYRAPSFNAQAFFDPSELSIADAEKVTAYELGAKTQFANRTVTLNMAAFYYDYSNQQFINVDPVTAAQTLLNIPKSRIYGAEADLSVRANDMLSFRAGIGVLSTKIKRGSVNGIDVAGNKLSNAPGFTANIGVDLTLMDSDAGKISLHPELAYQSSQFFEVINVPRLQQGGYALVNGRIDWESADGRFNASIWGKNLANKFYFSSSVDLLSGFGFDYNHIGGPRTYGVTLGVAF
ncbi:TonB-dependent receptor [Qipengyuania flava]|uniref:TonB-dependent receptor n=1 Tax=Qipengyuania flava TaxID=192812 RepID=UPI000AB63F5D